MNPYGFSFMSFGVGIMVGLTSLDVAPLMTPLLRLFGGMVPVVAAGTGLPRASVTKLVGAKLVGVWMHWKQKTMDSCDALVLACGSPGFAVGLTSVGIGSLIAPFLMLQFPNNPARVVGAGVFHAAILVSAMAFLHRSAGHVNWLVVPVKLAGSIPGVLVGSHLARGCPAHPRRVGIGSLRFATGNQLVFAH
jgi:uncharacterized membrane protein YfcA